MNFKAFKELKRDQQFQDHYQVLENKDNIARALYAIYNGGPSDFSKFIDRSSRQKYYLSDDLFKLRVGSGH